MRRAEKSGVIEPGVTTGVLRETLAGGHKAVIAHEAIPGYIEAMTMEFDAPAGSTPPP